MLCDTLPKVGKRNAVKRPLNGVLTLGWVTVESQWGSWLPRLRARWIHLGAAVLHHCVTSVLVSLVEKGSPDWAISVVSPVTFEIDIKVVHGNQLTQSQSFAVNRSGESDDPSRIHRNFPV